MNLKILRYIIAALLLATGLVHWFLPAIHRAAPGQWSLGLIPIPHDLLHTLFNLNGVGYLILMGMVLDWLPIKPHHLRWLYAAIILFAGLTIVAWVLFSQPSDRTMLDTIDKAIEVGIIATGLWIIRLLPPTTVSRRAA